MRHTNGNTGVVFSTTRKRGGAKQLHHKWRPDNDKVAECIGLAEMDRHTDYICEQTGLTKNQVGYILHKFKVVEGYRSGHTYSSGWRTGTSDLARTFENTMLPHLKQDASTRLTPLVTHPTPKLVSNGQP